MADDQTKTDEQKPAPILDKNGKEIPFHRFMGGGFKKRHARMARKDAQSARMHTLTAYRRRFQDAKDRGLSDAEANDFATAGEQADMAKTDLQPVPEPTVDPIEAAKGEVEDGATLTIEDVPDPAQEPSQAAADPASDAAPVAPVDQTRATRAANRRK